MTHPHSPPTNPLHNSLQYIKGIGPRRAATLQRLSLKTIADVLYHFPARYDEPHEPMSIRDVQVNRKVVIHGTVMDLQRRRAGAGRRMNIFEAMVGDETGCIQAIWFNRNYMDKRFAKGARVQLRGTVSFYNQYQIRSPEIEFLTEEETNTSTEAPPKTPPCTLTAVYPVTEGIRQNTMRALIASAMQVSQGYLQDLYPLDFCTRLQLMPLPEAIQQIHKPTTDAELQSARRRLKFDELLRFQIGLHVRSATTHRQPKQTPLRISDAIRDRIQKRFPYTLTTAQQRAISDIESDMQSVTAMNRLLIGDVGSGKTAVALWSILATVANKQQAALMAPTEILAEQHHLTFSHLLADSKVKFELLTSRCTKSNRKEILQRLQSGDLHFLIGTQALLQEDVRFQHLQLVIIDEQHKFGVAQRATLRKKSPATDLLVMTATPIPRSLTMAMYGDLDVSILDEMPPGRGEIRSRWVRPEEAKKMDSFITEKLQAGRQAYFVYPLVESSDAVPWKAAAEAIQDLQKRFPGFRLALLHGKLPSHEKQAIMQQFKIGAIDILVSTTVIEVGIDVPNAALMIVEEASQFGLSQLHQLRGRIGRGEHASYAFFVGEARTPEALQRLQTIASTQDGFLIAETDLKLRGPGEFFGLRQSGLPELKLADLVEDADLSRLASFEAKQLLQQDPKLQHPDWQFLRLELKRYFQERWTYTTAG